MEGAPTIVKTEFFRLYARYDYLIRPNEHVYVKSNVRVPPNLSSLTILDLDGGRQELDVQTLRENARIPVKVNGYHDRHRNVNEGDYLGILAMGVTLERRTFVGNIQVPRAEP